MFIGLFICLSVFLISPKRMDLNEIYIWPIENKMVEFGKDPYNILGRNKISIFKGPIFNIFSLTFWLTLIQTYISASL